MALTDEQLQQVAGDAYRALASKLPHEACLLASLRAIESAATAPLLDLIADLKELNRLNNQIINTQHAAMVNAEQRGVAKGLEECAELIAALTAQVEQAAKPIDMVLHCPACGMQHVDAPSPTDGQNLRMWSNPPHKSHLCRTEDGGCGHIWRPADVPTNGVAAIKTKGKADSRHPVVPRPQPVGYASARDISLMAEVGRGALVWAKALGNDSIPLYTAPPKAVPLTDAQEHETDGDSCWCDPDTAYEDPETGAKVIVHRRPQ